MVYISTRAEAAPAGFADVLLGGLAEDGGLYVPEKFPIVDFSALVSRAESEGELLYAEAAAEIIHPYLGDFMEKDELQEMTAKTYGGFAHPRTAPLKYVEEMDFYLLELFYGPTLAFKDMALQLAGNLFDYALKKSGRHATILTATSGDTGAAAISACLGKTSLSAFVLHPEGRISEIQRKMMTSVDSPNIKNIAVKGNFDDCQNLVKQLFQDSDLKSLNLSAMNSINWARIAAQAAYYFWALLELGSKEGAAFYVPSGNFGNIYSGWVAAQMGAPVNSLTAAVNQNDTLAHFFNTGELVHKKAVPTLAPAMDVSVPSNLERLIFEILGRSSTSDFYGVLAGGEPQHLEMGEDFRDFWSAYSIEDMSGIEGGIKGIIQNVKERAGLWIDPHTAVGVGSLLTERETGNLEAANLKGTPQIVLSTAHPAKFEELYADAEDPPVLPESFADLKSRTESFVVLEADIGEIKEHILNTQIS